MTIPGRLSRPLAAALLAAATVSAAPPPAPAAHGLDVAGMDLRVPPGDDFFRYANGTWLKKTEIPADRSSWGAGGMLVELTSKRTADLIREIASKEEAPGSDARKIADTYQTYLDEAAIEAKGLAPLAPELERIGAIADRKALSRALGGTIRADVDVLNATNLHTPHLFGLWVAQDLSDPTRYAPFLLQGGLGMPDRDYYLDASPKMADVRAKYLAHVAAMLRLAKVEDADAKAARVVELERRIAEVHWTHADTEQVAKGNNHWAAAEFAAKAPGIDWADFFAGAGLEAQQTFVVWQPSAAAGISALVGSAPLETWKEWMAFHAIDDRAAYLPKAFVDESFAFHGGVLSGTPKIEERWKRAVSVTNAALGYAGGGFYAERYFPGSAKARVEAMVRDLTRAFGTRIDHLAWMAPETKAKAKAKLAALRVGIGYPDAWRDYSALEVVRGDAFGNAERATLFEYRRNLAKLGKPIDRTEWVMTPQTVNAVNLPVMNALQFPAAILQPPYFDPERTNAMNYGAIGSIIGHEVSHSFDDQGALFSSTGKLENWWTKADFAHFEKSAELLVKQYDAYRPFPDLSVRGRQTLSENIADVAGLAAAYDGWRLSLDGKPAPAAQGMNGEQQFFVSFAQAWRSKSRDAQLRRQILTDGHAPAEYRADTVRNIDAWYGAFPVKPGQKLYLAPENRVRIW